MNHAKRRRAKHNAFVFNFIKNNEKDIARLKQCFYSRHVLCPVQVYEHPSYGELNDILEQMVAMDFELFNYIVVVVLDSTNPCEFLLTPQADDGQHFNVNADLLRRFGDNETMLHKPRLVVLQTNRNFDTRKVYREPNDTGCYLYRGISNEIYANCLSSEHWPEREGSSPFVRVFCEHFERNSRGTFKALWDGIVRDLEPYGVTPEVSIEKSSLVYGPALSHALIKAYFHEDEQLTRHLQ